jgi:large subunit ribosomal protein L23
MQKSPYEIVVRPIITEKSGIAAQQRQYTFLVDPQANKVEIAEAVSYIFNVDVQKVRILNRAPKFGRWGRKRVKRQGSQKKAIVTLPVGQRIDAFEGA